MIYADNAATTKMDEEAFDVMKNFLCEKYANASQPYSFARQAKKALKSSRETIANCIGALPEEIYFTSGGTEGDNWAIKGFFNRNKNLIITDKIEHHAVLNSCLSEERRGRRIVYLDVNKEGIVLPKTLEEIISFETGLVSIMLANNEIGTIEPIRELSNISHRYGAVFHTDAVQAVGHIPIKVNEVGVDLLSSSAHKFNGPKGIGFMYIRKEIKINPLINGGSQEFGKRAGTENIAYIAAMAKALENNIKHIDENQKKLFDMENNFLAILEKNKIDFIRNGAKEHIPGNINISIKNASGEMMLHRLDLKKICISTGSACDSVDTQISHVIKAIKVPADYAKGTIRISFGKYNKIEDAEKIANAIIGILK